MSKKQPAAITLPGWWEHFENSNSRKMERTSYYSAPTGTNSNGYLTLVLDHGPDGILAFGVFHALCQLLGSLNKDRRKTGAFVDSRGQAIPITRLAVMTHLPEEIIIEALPLLQSVGWLTFSTGEQSPSALGSSPPHGKTSPSSPPGEQSPSALGSSPPSGGEGSGEDRRGGDSAPTPPEFDSIHKIAASFHIQGVPPDWLTSTCHRFKAVWDERRWRTQTGRNLLTDRAWTHRLRSFLEEEFQKNRPTSGTTPTPTESIPEKIKK